MSTSDTSVTSPTSDLARAQHPEATAAELEQLATSDAPDVQEAVAQHPNTPPRVLWELAETYPAAVWKNPVLGLIAMESPAWMNDLPRAAADALFSHAEAPVAWLREAVHGTRTVRRAVARNLAAPPEVLDMLAADRSSFAYREALRNPSLPSDVLLRELQTHAPGRSGYHHQRLRGVFLMHPQLPADLREALWKGGLSTDGHLFGKDAQPLTNDERARLMALGPVGRAVVAANPWTPAEQLRELADDDAWRVRGAVAGNVSAPPDVIGTLVADPVLDVGEKAALHWNLPADTAALMRRCQIAATRSDPDRPLTPEDRRALHDLGAMGMLLLAGDPGCGAAELRTFAARDEQPVQKAVCGNPSTPPEVIRNLVEEDRRELLPYAASNPHLPEELLQACTDEELKLMVDILLRREDLPEAIAARLVDLARRSDLYFGTRTPDADLYPGRYPSFAAPPPVSMQHQAIAVALHPAIRAGQAREIVAGLGGDAIPVEVLRYAAGVEGACTREEALRRLHPKVEVLLYIAGHDDSHRAEGRRTALAHKGFPPRVRALFLRAGASEDFSEIRRPRGALMEGESAVLCALGPFGRRLAAIHPDTPAEMLQYLAEQHWDEVMLELAGNPLVPAPLWPYLLTAPCLRTHRRAFSNPNAPAELIDLLQRAGLQDAAQDEDQDPPLSPEVEARLLAMGPVARRLVAGHRYTRPEVLRALAGDPSHTVREQVALNEQTPVDVLNELARTGEAATTSRPDLLPEVPGFIRREQSVPGTMQMRHRVRIQDMTLRNPSLPTETIAEMAEDGAVDHKAIAGNPSTSPDTLARIAACRWSYARAVAAENPSTPQGVLDLLRRAGASDDLMALGPPSAPVTASERERLRTLGPFGQELSVANHPETPDWNPNAERDAQVVAMRALAVRPSTDADTLARLVAEGERETMPLVARHPNTPPYILGFMLGDRNQELRAAAAQHPKVPADLLTLLRKAGADEELHDPQGRHGTFHPKPISLQEQTRLLHLGDYGRKLLASHPDAHERMLHALADPRVFANDYLRDLLSRETLPFHCLERLFVIESHDPDVFERFQAHPDAPSELFVNETPCAT